MYEAPDWNFLAYVNVAAVRAKQPKWEGAAIQCGRRVTFKGTVEDMIDRRCPVSGGMGSHILLLLADDSTIEVHLATTEFTKMIELNLRKGDRIEVTGFKTEFEGVPTIFARAVKRGIDEYVFRDTSGKPVW